MPKVNKKVFIYGQEFPNKSDEQMLKKIGVDRWEWSSYWLEIFVFHMMKIKVISK